MLYNGANNRRLLHGNLHCIYPLLHGTSLTLTSPYPHVVKAPLELPTPGLPITHTPHPIVFLYVKHLRLHPGAHVDSNCSRSANTSNTHRPHPIVFLHVKHLCPPICPSSAHANRSLKRQTPGPPSSTRMHSTSVFLYTFNVSNVIMPMLLLSCRIGFSTLQSRPSSASISFCY